ncbi:hypothetical protein POM88_052772 [Heracleum sosnowskyi]|uniref:Uncharacterized protein n=1 Tax=Heracleum sosnowskyi TaxID=360622 RepID=A0AAD8GRM2_9APIA|nr:hypothetical protein POM88_052772 [Heracleum sosnowskyi]
MVFLGVGSFGPQSGISVPDMFGAGGPSQGLDQNPWEYGLKSEASRESADVIMNHINLVEILMDVEVQLSTKELRSSLVGIGDALVQGSIIGVASEMPERYMQAVVAGTGVSGM